MRKGEEILTEKENIRKYVRMHKRVIIRKSNILNKRKIR